MSIGDRLARGSRGRTILLTVAGAVAVVVYTQLVLPGRGAGRGTPGAILFSGAVLGMVNALTAVGLVLIYRTIRIINFAQTAIGAAGATLTFQFIQLTGVPFVLSVPAGLVLAGLLGLAFDLIFGRRFLNASRMVLTVATIAVAGLSVITVTAVGSLPFFPDQTLIQSLGAEELRRLLPFPGWSFTVGDFPIRFGFAEVFAIEMAVVVLLGVAAFLRFTRAGVAVRAMAENRERAALLGIGVGALSSIVWTITGVLGGASVMLNGFLTTPAAAQGVAPGVLVPALAAAVIGRFRSIPVTVAAAVGIGVVATATQFSYASDSGLVQVALFVVVAGGLLLQRRREGRAEEGAGVSWEAVEEQRPVPKELATLPTVRTTRWVLIAIGILGVGVYPYLVDTGPVLLGGVIALTAVVAVSIVVLTGWGGQVSLGQFAFAAIGALVGGALTSRVGVPFWFAVPVAAAVTGAVAAAIGIPALRIRGLFLAAATLAFGFAAHQVLFNERYFGWLMPEELERPTLFFLDFADQRSMYYLCVATLVLALVVVGNLRRSRTGRLLIAARENEANLESLGVPVLRTKITAFAIAGGLAGMAGAVLAHQQLGVTADSFTAQRSVDVFLLTVIGGVGSPVGALLGSAYWSITEYFFPTQPVIQFFRPFAALLVLYVVPGGLVSVVMRLRDQVLRIIAQRRQIVVPSLFADYDPEALARRLIPLRAADAADRAGADAERYALASELYKGRGDRIVDRLTGNKPSREAAAISAAAVVESDTSGAQR